MTADRTPPLDLARLSELAEKAQHKRWFLGDIEGTALVADSPDGYVIARLDKEHGVRLTDEERAFIAAFDPTTAKALLSEIVTLRTTMSRFIEASNIALMIREDLARDGSLSLLSALEPLRHATLEAEAAATEPAEREAAR